MSLIKANAVQIGQSPTATQNFTLAVPSSPDGTIKLARGNSGATTQDVLSVDASGNINGLVKSTGSTTARSLANRFADVVNVKDFGAIGNWNGTIGQDDTPFIQNAVTFCNTNNTTLYWPSGTYRTTASITNFHSIYHSGDGIIERDSNLFKITNENGLTNDLFVAVTGSNSNDGLSSLQPLATLQKAIDVLQNYTLTGHWQINLAAGNYSTSSNRTTTIGFNYWDAGIVNSDAYTKDGILSNNFITIKGPDVGYSPKITTSTSSISLGAGSKTLTVQTGLTTLIVGNQIMLTDTVSNNRMTGTVTSYNSGTGVLVFNNTTSGSGGPFSNWLISNPWPEPTAIFEGGGAAAVGIICTNAKVIFKDLKFIQYNGSSSSAGISASKSYIRTLNVHTYDCFYGISSEHGVSEICGGSIYGNATKTNTYGIRSIFHNFHSVGNQTATGIGQGPLISYCYHAALIQENSTGHFDYCSIEDNEFGLRITNNSRVNCSGSHFKRNTIGIMAEYGSNLYRDNVNFYTGTSDENNENTIIQTYSTDISLNPYANSGTATDFITTNQIVTGTTTSISVLSKILEGGFYSPNLSSIRKPEMIKLYAYGKQSGTAGTKQYKIRLGSTILATVTIPSTVTGDWTCESIITFFSPTSQKAMFSYFAHNGDAIKVSVDDVGTEDMSTDKTLTFEVQLTNSADSITVNHAHIEVWG